jgi:hypothetical protein
MYKTISNEIIRKFQPCYDPSKFITDENEKLPIKDWIKKYRNVVPVKDILWILLRKEFLSKKDLKLFVVWCAREALKLVENPDKISVNACNVAEKYANGEATKEELDVAYIAADDVANSLAYAARAAHDADVLADAAIYDADAYYIAYYAARATATAARAAATAARADANAYLAVTSAARVVYFATFAASDTVSNDDADAAYAATRTSQLDKLLTYFE